MHNMATSHHLSFLLALICLLFKTNIIFSVDKYFSELLAFDLILIVRMLGYITEKTDDIGV